MQSFADIFITKEMAERGVTRWEFKWYNFREYRVLLGKSTLCDGDIYARQFLLSYTRVTSIKRGLISISSLSLIKLAATILRYSVREGSFALG